MVHFLFLGLLASASANLEVEKIQRVVDLRTHVAVITSTFTLKSKSKTDHFFVAYNAQDAKHLAIVQATKEGGVELEVEQASEKIVNAPVGSAVFRVALPKPIEAGEKGTVVVTGSFTNVIRPFPAEITQDESQLVKFVGSAVEYSPYPVATQTTQVKLFSTKIESHTTEKAQVQGSTITYGPYQNIAPFSAETVSIHYENNYPFVTMKTALKEIEISHWGNIAVEEHYLLAHTGAALKGPFSRFSYQRSQNPQSPSFRKIVARLPAGASDIYYRDHIGNISTSHVRDAGDNVVFEVEPRFPMFGGWKTDFYTGYNVPASNFLYTSSSGSYVLNITFASPFPQAVVDELVVKVVLPEGASNIRWSTPFDIDSQSYENRVTYLDTFGRPVLVLKKANVVSAHNQFFQVAYDFPAWSSYREPLMLAAAFFAFFVAALVYLRIDFTK